MSRGMPSMVALLDCSLSRLSEPGKIAEMLADGSKSRAVHPASKISRRARACVGNLADFWRCECGSVREWRLRDLVERFKQSGQAQAADSWVKTGPNQPIGSDQLEQAIGPDVLGTLSERTGLSREELLSRLTRELPAAVDKFTRRPATDRRRGGTADLVRGVLTWRPGVVVPVGFPRLAMRAATCEVTKKVLHVAFPRACNMQQDCRVARCVQTLRCR